jgi:hypothetical protein
MKDEGGPGSDVWGGGYNRNAVVGRVFGFRVWGQVLRVCHDAAEVCDGKAGDQGMEEFERFKGLEGFWS